MITNTKHIALSLLFAASTLVAQAQVMVIQFSDETQDKAISISFNEQKMLYSAVDGTAKSKDYGHTTSCLGLQFSLTLSGDDVSVGDSLSGNQPNPDTGGKIWADATAARNLLAAGDEADYLCENVETTQALTVGTYHFRISLHPSLLLTKEGYKVRFGDGKEFVIAASQVQNVQVSSLHTSVDDAAVEETCTETGLTEGSHCSVCDKVLVAQQTIAAKGHIEVIDDAVEATCTETGLTEGKHCSRCKEVIVAQQSIAAKGHIEVIDAAVEATCTETGLTEGKHCSRCEGILVARETVPAAHRYGADDQCVFCSNYRTMDQFTLEDRQVYDLSNIYSVGTLTYIRNFRSTVWQCLYVPFSIPVEALAEKGLKVAQLNDTHMYDNDHDGVPEVTELEFFTLKTGSTVANFPYMIRPAATGEITLQLEDILLKSAVSTSIECSTVKQLFTVRGTYTGVSGADMYANTYYAPSNNGLSRASSASVSLAPQRWYLSVTNKKDGSIVTLAPQMRVIVDGDCDEETGIQSIEEEIGANAACYSLDGRRQRVTRSGLYLQNGKIIFMK